MKKQVSNIQMEKANLFKALHERHGIFVTPNPWDAGSARLLTGLGFEALATTSAGFAFSLGLPDGEAAITREQTLRNCEDIVRSTSLPVAGDLENCYGDDPETCAETILLASRTGLVGGSIEDATGRSDSPIYDFDLSVKRVRAAVNAARTLSCPFTLTARAENFLYGRPDLQDTIRRLVAYAEAGADVLFAPGLTTLEEIATVVKAVSPKPVNVIQGLANSTLTVKALAAICVKRISLGSSLARAAYGSFFYAAEEVQRDGTFNFAKSAMPYARLNKEFSQQR